MKHKFAIGPDLLRPSFWKLRKIGCGHGVSGSDDVVETKCLPTVSIKGNWFQYHKNSISCFKPQFSVFYLYKEWQEKGVAGAVVSRWSWAENLFAGGSVAPKAKCYQKLRAIRGGGVKKADFLIT